MFGKKKKKNLDVKARSKPLKALRMRMAAGAMAVSAGVVLVLFVVWKGGEFLLDRYVYTNPAFAVDRLDVLTDGIIPVEQLRAWASVRKGDNILQLDLARIKRELEQVALIESATVERILPRQVIIRIAEREPIAKVAVYQTRSANGLLERTLLYLDRQGMVIPPVLRALNTPAFDQATRNLPLLTGVNPAELRPGRKVASEPVLAALRWIRDFQRSEMAGRVDVRAIDITAGLTFTVHTEQGNEVTFSSGNFESQLARWRSVHGLAMSQRKTLSSLDLAVTNYVPAVWVDWTNSPPPVLQSTTSPYRKRNV